jgi:hypothetical protein
MPAEREKRKEKRKKKVSVAKGLLFPIKMASQVETNPRGIPRAPFVASRFDRFSILFSLFTVLPAFANI